MTTDIIKLIVGFLLTSVLGGVLGYYFQNRTWRHQFRVKLLEAEQATATKLFEELSRLMDKRLYRMRQVHWKLKRSDFPAEVVEEQMQRYREILCEWNDSLNRNLALAEIYFGPVIRGKLEETIYEEFSRVGRILEARYSHRQRGEGDVAWRRTGDDLVKLGSEIYRINVRMIRSIQSRRRGLSQIGNETEEVHQTDNAVGEGNSVGTNRSDRE